MDIKKILKVLKLNENTISTLLGILVIVVLGILVINYFRNLPTGTTFPTGIETEITEQPMPEKHTVARGESLWKIAQKYYNDGHAWVSIAKANNLKNPDLIEEGQEIIIPILENQNEKETSPSFSPKSEQRTPSEAKYVVQKGDDLWHIALKKYSDAYKWVEIAKANKLTNPDLIHPGNELVLPK